MSNPVQDNPAVDWPATSEVYRRAFLRTVLRLDGIAGRPSHEQAEKATKMLRLYGAKVAASELRGLAVDNDIRRGRLSQPAGVEHAFMFVRFDSVLPPDGPQQREFTEWVKNQDLR